MPDTTTNYSDKIVDTIVELLKEPKNPELEDAQALIARRVATSAALTPSRIPAAANITIVGGYLNLLERAGEDVLRLQAIAGALGLAGPMDLRYQAGGPTLYFTTRETLRVTGSAQAAAPTHFQIRSDFVATFDTMLSRLRSRGCELPILSTNSPLPAHGTVPPDDVLPIIGRSLKLVPGLALKDATTDTFIVADAGSGATSLYARQVTTEASDAASLSNITIDVFTCDATSCTAATATVKVEELAPLFAAAGWFPTAISAPTSLSATGGYTDWRNVTGLVAGETTLGDELRKLFTPMEIAGSALRDRTNRVWDGTTFASS
jgi:hypothetical protein